MNEYKSVMLVSPTKVKGYAVVGLNVDDGVLGNCIRLAHIHVGEVAGMELMDKVRLLVYNKIQGTGSTIDDEENIAYKTLLEEYLQPALAYATAVEACIINELKIRNMGVVKNEDTNVRQVGFGEVTSLASYYRTYLNDAYNRLTEFICAEKAAFIEVPEGFCTCSDKPLYANTNLWLGPSK